MVRTDELEFVAGLLVCRWPRSYMLPGMYDALLRTYKVDISIPTPNTRHGQKCSAFCRSSYASMKTVEHLRSRYVTTVFAAKLLCPPLSPIE